MKWVIIYWLASQSPQEAPYYMDGTSFGSERECIRFAEGQDDIERYQCAESDGGPLDVESISSDLTAIGDPWMETFETQYFITGVLECQVHWHPPLVLCD